MNYDRLLFVVIPKQRGAWNLLENPTARLEAAMTERRIDPEDGVACAAAGDGEGRGAWAWKERA